MQMATCDLVTREAFCDDFSDALTSAQGKAVLKTPQSKRWRAKESAIHTSQVFSFGMTAMPGSAFG